VLGTDQPEASVATARQGLVEAFGGVGDQIHTAVNAAPLEGLSQELASEAPAPGRSKEFSDIAG